MHPAADAYAQRAVEYADRLGTMDSVHPVDRVLVDTWAARAPGPVLDAGSGPGHWTNHLVRSGLDARGIDITPPFVDHARARYPHVRFDVADIDDTPYPARSFGTILSWYSTIHHDPEQIQRPLSEFARILRPGGLLVLGYSDGPSIGVFDHAVTPAYRWPTTALGALIDRAGLEVVEAHTRTGAGHRPHGAIVARLPADR